MRGLFYFLAFAGLLFLGTSCSNEAVFAPKAEAGVIDLRNVNLDHPVRLEGDFGIRWKEFSPPEKIAEPKEFFHSPGVWPKDKEQIRYATYTLKILLPENFQDNTEFLFYDQGSNYAAFVNGVFLGRDGEPSVTKSEIADYWPKVFTCRDKSLTLNLVIHISNHHHSESGLWYPIYIGSPTGFRNYFFLKAVKAFVLVGSILMIGFYHFIVFMNRRLDITTLYFSYLCIGVALRILVTEERFITYWFPLRGEKLYTLEYISFYALPPLMAGFIHKIFPEEYSARMKYMMQAVCILSILLLFFTNMEFFTGFISYFRIFILFGIGHAIYALIMAYVRKREGSAPMLIGNLTLLITGGNDILFISGMISTFYMLPVGIIAFIFSQAFLLSIRYSKSFETSEMHYRNLQKSNEELNLVRLQLEEAVATRTKQLDRTLKSLRDDLNIAKKIQKAIISKIPPNEVGIHFAIRYFPMGDVGGDFYDITYLRHDYVRIFMADATGHGIQGAMVTMLLKSEYEGIKQLIQRPEGVIEILNNEFHSKYRNIGSYYSCVVADIDLAARRLYYSSAGHHDLYMQNHDTLKVLQSGGKIIGLQACYDVPFIEMDFNEGSRLFLFTDGMFEQFGASEEAFGEDRLKGAISECLSLNTEEASDYLLKKLNQFIIGKEVQDDITLITVDWKKSS